MFPRLLFAFSITVLLGLLSPLQAQPLPEGANGWRPEAALQYLGLRTVVQRPGGLRWLGTDDGVYRYDGTRLVALNDLRRGGPLLPAAPCNHLLALPNGDLWLGTEGGLFRFTAAGQLRALPLPAPAAPTPRIDGLRLAADGRGVWALQERGGLRYYQLNGQPAGALIPESEPGTALWIAPSGELWLGRAGGHTRQLSARGQLRAEWAHPHQLLRPAVAPTGEVWLLGSRAAYQPRPGQPLTAAVRWSTTEPEEWMDSAPGNGTVAVLGTSCLWQIGWQATRPARPRLLFAVPVPVASTTSLGGRLRQDAAGDWWLFNTSRRGTWHRALGPAFIRALAGPGGRPYSVRLSAALPDGQRLVSAYEAGIMRQAVDSPLAPLRPWPRMKLPNGRMPVLTSVLPAGLRGASGQAEWLAGCAGPFLAFNPLTGSLRVLPTAGLATGFPDVRCLAREPRTQRVWGGARTGLYVLDSLAATFRPYQLPHHPRPLLAGRTVEDICPDGRGGLWLATMEGVEWLDPATGTLRHYGPDAPAGPRRAALDGARCFYRDARRGRLWVGTRAHGLLVIEPDGRVRAALGAAQGLPNSSVSTITPDPNGGLWLGTYAGLVRYEPEAAGRVALFTTADGLSADECNGRAAAVDPHDGSLLIGGVAGLHRIWPGHRPAALPRPAPRLHLVAYQALHLRADSSHLYHRLTTDALPALRLTPTQPLLDLYLALSDNLGPARYSYRIHGWLDGRWLPLGTTPQLRLQGLPAGDYEVEIRGETAQGVLAPNTLRLPLVVTAEWYRRPLVWAVAALAAVAGVWLVQRQRLRRQQHEYARRARLAADLHDEVGGLLTRVTLQAELLQELPAAAVPARLAALREDSQAATATVRDIIWSVSPEADTPDGLLGRMHDVLVHATQATGLSVDLQPENWPDDGRQLLPPDVRQHVYLTFKEAVTNVLRHAPAATRLDVTVRYLGRGQLLLRVTNDGPEVSGPGARAGQGLRNMRQRAAALGWHLHAGPRPGGGWEVELKP